MTVMPRLLTASMLLGFSCIVLPAAAQSKECETVVAPAAFEQKGPDAETTTNPGNRGIMPTGFVGLVDKQVVHGIDVSKWQASADFVRVKECGGSFAYVRLSAGRNPDNELEYRAHWSNARAVGLEVGPYHNLTIIDPESSFETLSDAEIRSLHDANLESARAQARLFVERLHELLGLDPTADVPPTQMGLPYLPIALDVSVRPQSQLSTSRLSEFGREIYGPAVCEWIATVKSDPALAGQPVLIFTLPLLFEDYHLQEAPCDLSDTQFWISHRPTDGAGNWSEARPELHAAIVSLCGPAEPPNRCIFEQYTSFGGFALFQPKEGLDLDRFYGSIEELRRILQTARHQ